MAQLNEAGVGYVVLSKYLLEDTTWRLWKRHMPYAPYYSDERYLVYSTAPVYGRDLEQPKSFAPGIGLVEGSLASFCSADQITAVVTATWATTAPPANDYAVQLTATSEETGEQRQWPDHAACRRVAQLTMAGRNRHAPIVRAQPAGSGRSLYTQLTGSRQGPGQLARRAIGAGSRRWGRVRD